MATESKERVYPDAEVTGLLSRTLQHWSLTEGCLCRTYRTGGWKATLMVVNTIGHLAEAAWHHPDIAISYASVAVRLSTHSAGGITDKDFALARKIEEVIQWQPAREGSPLEGTPVGDERFAYVTYDP